ncbi:5-(carboxyamino)imidazole ribonucleotide synthase [Anoxybacteroides tepidamans]|uniref:5-(carboxyamino)imidazole ribonucleotide synthase n=1 Tax=Anoxybacteroides tepidamans TaxID=265948 RepID=UPI001605F552|nr:5-(carboxyamino)imidazole ribonucleotide synthase [Anoxybacillus tepidamans]
MILNKKTIIPGQTIGIIGGGQLGRMMAISAKEMGFRVAVLDPVSDSPCGQVADIEITGEYNDIEAIKRLADVSDVITYEFENIDAAALEWLVEHSRVPQGSNLLAITQDRATEKKAVTDAGLPVAPYIEVRSSEELRSGIDTIGLPCVLKTCRGGYDGKGQAVIRRKEDIEKALLLLQSGPCVLESWLSFEKEISVIVTRNGLGDMSVFPVGENIHVDNILHQTIVPARISPHIAEKAIVYAETLAKHFELIGTLAVEMFLTKEGDIYINELAPRPHNSGHYTINACATSQFQQHVRAICNWPLGSTKLLTPAVMVNILGEHMQPVIDNIPKFQNMHLHLYGKKEAKKKRKMGHVTVLAETVEEALQAINALHIWNEKEGGSQ